MQTGEVMVRYTGRFPCSAGGYDWAPGQQRLLVWSEAKLRELRAAQPGCFTIAPAGRTRVTQVVPEGTRA